MRRVTISAEIDTSLRDDIVRYAEKRGLRFTAAVEAVLVEHRGELLASTPGPGPIGPRATVELED